jgi:hypothetical protein
MTDQVGSRALGGTGSEHARRGALRFSREAALLFAVSCNSGSSLSANVSDGTAPADLSSPAPADAGLDLPPVSAVGLPGVRFVVSLGGSLPGDLGDTFVTAMFFEGDCGPGLCHSTVRLNGTVSVNGLPMPMQLADWGLYYTRPMVPDPPDGLYRFEVSADRQIATRSVRVPRVIIDPPPGGRLRAGPTPVVVTWAPPFPSSDDVTVSLSSCVMTTVKAVTPSSATLVLEAITDPCQSILSVMHRSTTPAGAPFRAGTIEVASVSAREVLVVK